MFNKPLCNRVGITQIINKKMAEKKTTKAVAAKETTAKKVTKACAAKTCATKTTAKKTTAKAAVVYVNAENAGFRAGDIYQVLAAAEKALTVAEIAKAAKVAVEDAYLGLGWLLKEGKIASTEDNKVALA